MLWPCLCIENVKDKKNVFSSEHWMTSPIALRSIELGNCWLFKVCSYGLGYDLNMAWCPLSPFRVIFLIEERCIPPRGIRSWNQSSLESETWKGQTQICFYNFSRFIYFMYECFHLHVCMYTTYLPWGSEEGIWSPGTGILGSCEPVCGYLRVEPRSSTRAASTCNSSSICLAQDTRI